MKNAKIRQFEIIELYDDVVLPLQIEFGSALMMINALLSSYTRTRLCPTILGSQTVHPLDFFSYENHLSHCAMGAWNVKQGG